MGTSGALREAPQYQVTHMENKKIADSLQRSLINNGFVVQRYNAYSTDNIYLKLDYGVCNSIRVSDRQHEKLIEQITSDRGIKIELYGVSGYRALMLKSKEDNSGSKGFWQKAYIVR